MSLDAYYLHGLSSLYVHIVVPEWVQEFKECFIFQIQVFIFFDPEYFYEMAICCITLVPTSYNNTVLYKLNTFIKKVILYGIAGSKLERKTYTIDRCSPPHIFLENTTDKLRLDFV